VRFVVDRVAQGQVLRLNALVFYCQYYAINAPYSFSSSYHYYYETGKQAKPGTLKQCNALLDIREL
jgi:hypothetical protein